MINQTENTINLNEFPFECACGECFRTIQAAAVCRKCRNYSVFGYCTHVIDQRTGDVVHGTEPTEEEYEVAALEWESFRAIERKEMEMQRLEWEEERELRRLQKAEARLVAEEDRLWDIQDRLMAG